MSTEKRTVSSVDVITFYYETSVISTLINNVTSFKAKYTDKEGKPDYDRIVLSDDESAFLLKELKTAMLLAFDELFRVINSDSISHNAALTLDVAGSVTASYVDIVDNDNYRTINIDIMDDFIEKVLVNYILSAWYRTRGLMDDAAIHKQEYLDALIQVSERSLSFRIK